jgi:hypothetical protein
MISVPVVALTEGVLKTMFLNKLKNAAVLLLVVFALMMGAGAVISQTSTREQPDKGKAVKEAEKLVKEAEHALNEAKKALKEAQAKEKADMLAVPASKSDKDGAKTKTRWEYKALSYADIKSVEFNRRGTDTSDGGLNMLGDEGWELVAIEPPVRNPHVPVGDRPALYVFKRQKK